MTKFSKLNRHLENVLTELDMAMEEAFKIDSSSNLDFLQIGKLGRSIGLIREFQAPIFTHYPELAPPPPWYGQQVPEMNENEKLLVSKLSAQNIKDVDNALLSNIDNNFQKVAKIVACTIENNRIQKDLPVLFYRDRIIIMAENGDIEYQGNLKFMRYSEIKLLKL